MCFAYVPFPLDDSMKRSVSHFLDLAVCEVDDFVRFLCSVADELEMMLARTKL